MFDEVAEYTDRLAWNPPVGMTGAELARAYDDLRVRIIALNAAQTKDLQAIDDVMSRLSEVQKALKAGYGIHYR